MKAISLLRRTGCIDAEYNASEVQRMGRAAVTRICVFCGSSSGARRTYEEGAAVLGTLLARRGIGLVFGGGRIGLMGILADAVLAHGGEVIGVIPEMLVAKELAHTGVTDLKIVRTMHERKALMAELADGFIALPGGFGTLEELFEILTWAQLGLHGKACGLLNIGGFFEPLLRMADHAVAEGFVRPEHRELILDDPDPERLLNRVNDFRRPLGPRWLHREEI